MSEQIKHSPTPWTCDENRSLSYSLTDAKGFYFGSLEYSGHVVNEANAAHIVKCVNLHDELVEALKIAIGLTHVPERNQGDAWNAELESCQSTLTKATQ